jgi:hypothetical protein
MSTSRDVVYFQGVPVLDERDGGLFQKQEGTGDFRVYRRPNAGITSVVTSDAIYKNAEAFGTLDRAERVYKDWEAMGWNGAPSSPARVFARALEETVDEGDVPHPRRVRPEAPGNTDAVSPVVDPGAATWLWIEALIPARTHVTVPCHHYDINEAFRSAVQTGLPAAFHPYQDGDRNYVARATIKGAERQLPEPWELSDTVYLTGEDVRHWGLDVEIHRAVTYADLDVDMELPFEIVRSNFGPWTAKRARQQSWGVFAQNGASVQQEIYRGGQKETTSGLADRWTCLEWAVIITRRIMRQVHAAAEAGDAVSLFVDSVLCRTPIPHGTDVGEWGKEDTYSDGIYLHAPGLWDTRPVSTPHPSAEWKKHSGIGRTYEGSEQVAPVEPSTGFTVQVEKNWERDYEDYIRQYTQDWMHEDRSNSTETATSTENQSSWRDQLKQDAPF